ncbi:MAG: serine--tRNA ligase [Cytophagales bacterium]|nr:serine--tRNA ligase [Cytophagales bacterium]
MLQVSAIEDHFDEMILAFSKRGIKNIEEQLRSVLQLNNKRKSAQQELDALLQESNQLAKQIGQLYKEGKQDEANEAKEQTISLKEKSKELGEALNKLEEELTSALYNIPNVPHPSVPAGQTDEDNELIMTSTDQLPELGDDAKPHWDLIQDYDLIDFELGNKITGAGFPVYKNQGARLVRALINYFLDEATNAGFAEVRPPIVTNEASGRGTGQLPDKEGQMYHITDTDLYLIPTAEVPVTNLYRDTIQAEADLPIRNCAYTPCFRREAGSWGSHVRGLNRLHQFDKVEIVQVVKPENSYQVLDEMVAHVEKLVKSLELPYRILRLCGGDLGFTSALTYDFEVYSAAQKKWLEVSSVSNFEAYQANRLKLRYKNADGKKVLAHTLNGSALALPRIMAALVENNQIANGIKMPKVLKDYLGFEVISKKL